MGSLRAHEGEQGGQPAASHKAALGWQRGGHEGVPRLAACCPGPSSTHPSPPTLVLAGNHLAKGDALAVAVLGLAGIRHGESLLQQVGQMLVRLWQQPSQERGLGLKKGGRGVTGGREPHATARPPSWLRPLSSTARLA